KAELSALKPGQVVKVTLTRVKEKTDAVEEKKAPEKKDADKKPDKKEAEKKEADKKDLEKVAEKAAEPKDPEKVPEKAPEKKTTETRLLATRILILQESDEPVKAERGAKKKP